MLKNLPAARTLLGWVPIFTRFFTSTFNSSPHRVGRKVAWCDICFFFFRDERLEINFGFKGLTRLTVLCLNFEFMASNLLEGFFRQQCPMSSQLTQQLPVHYAISVQISHEVFVNMRTSFSCPVSFSIFRRIPISKPFSIALT